MEKLAGKIAVITGGTAASSFSLRTTAATSTASNCSSMAAWHKS